MFEDIPEMFNDIPRNIYIPPTPRVPRISFPVPLFLVLYIAFNLLYCIITDFSDSNILLFLRRHKQTTDNQKAKLLYKIGLNCTVCKVFKNIECRTCSESGLLFQRKLIIVCRWVGGLAAGGFNKTQNGHIFSH